MCTAFSHFFSSTEDAAIPSNASKLEILLKNFEVIFNFIAFQKAKLRMQGKKRAGKSRDL